MKVELETNNKGVCTKFTINGEDFGSLVNEVNIIIKAGEIPEITLKGNAELINLNSKKTKISIEENKKHFRGDKMKLSAEEKALLNYCLVAIAFLIILIAPWIVGAIIFGGLN